MEDDPQPQKIPLIFYRTAAGGEPVREWLKGLDEAERQAIGRDLLRAQWRWPVGMPLCRPMGSGLWKVRTDLPAKRTARVMPRRMRIWRRRESARRSWSDEHEAYGFQH